MAWFILLIGIIFTVFSLAGAIHQLRETAWPAKNGKSAPAVHGEVSPWESSSPALQVVALDEVLDIGARVDLLTDTVERLLAKINRLETRFGQWEQQRETVPPDGRPEQAPPGSFQQQIREAFASGKDVTELAQQYGKGKGEIELILNMKR
ncbi:MAG: hypothetical protein ACYC2T_03000 [Bacillota bacterium]